MTFNARHHLGSEREPRLRTEFDRRTAVTPAMVHSIDEKGRLIGVSDAWLEKLGYTRDEVLGRFSSDFLTPASRQRAVKHILPEFFRRGRCENVEYQMVCKNGRVIDVLLSAILDVGANGQGRTSIAVIMDVTALKVAERKLMESEALYRLLADNSTDMVFQLDRNFVRSYVSPACREILGYAPEEMIGRTPLSTVHPDDAARLEKVFQSLLDGCFERQSIINRIRHRDGRWIWVEAQLRVLKDGASQMPSGIIGALRDISIRKAVEDELAQANLRLEKLAGQDGLTNLANRRAFDDALAQECKHMGREGKSLGLIMIDVDWFKAYNDCYGHIAGDTCLRWVCGAIITAANRPADVAARYGGEEFAVLLPDTDELGATAIAERIRKIVERLAMPHENAPNRIVTVSAGAAAMIAGGGLCPEELVQAADRALYCAKNAGRNIVVGAGRISDASQHYCPPAA